MRLHDRWSYERSSESQRRFEAVDGLSVERQRRLKDEGVEVDRTPHDHLDAAFVVGSTVGEAVVAGSDDSIDNASRAVVARAVWMHVGDAGVATRRPCIKRSG